MLALQALFEADCSGHKPSASLEERLLELPDKPSSGALAGYARTLVDGVAERRAQIDGVIAAHAPTWPVEQLPAVDRNILRIAIFEILFNNETPPKVAINEAVELAKRYGSETSSRFVNGVLGGVVSPAPKRIPTLSKR